MQVLLVFSCLLVGGYAIVCPPGVCDTMKCPSNTFCSSPTDVREETGGGFCGCCPVCIKQLDVGISCKPSPLLGAANKFRCYGNTKCDTNTWLCTYKCREEREKRLEQGRRLLGVSVPECDEDGSYKAWRNRGSQRVCLAKDGSETGHNMNRWETEGNECRCAREQDEYIKTGLIGKMFRCEENGNYSPVQCTGSVCFCADNRGKQIEGTDGVNIWEMHKMNC